MLTENNCCLLILKSKDNYGPSSLAAGSRYLLSSTTNVTICNAGFSGGEWSQKATFLTDTE